MSSPDCKLGKVVYAKFKKPFKVYAKFKTIQKRRNLNLLISCPGELFYIQNGNHFKVVYS